MFLPRTPTLVRHLFPGILFRKSTAGNAVYLTFDDGPDPEATVFVLQTLARAGAGATFFVLGRNASRFPRILKQVEAQGHHIGNHSMHHPDGFRSSARSYCEDACECHRILKEYKAYKSLFRPPYGHITPAQYRRLRRKYKVVLWDVIAEDYRPGMDAESCLKKLKKQTRKGSVIVFHDSARCLPLLRQVLPAYMAFLQEQGLQSRVLD